MPTGIKLSKKHGVNPTLLICFFCQEAKGVALMGKLENDAEAPRLACLDYEPCDNCKEQMARGITLIEVATRAIDGRPPIQEAHGSDPDIYPTGRWLVIAEEAIPKLFCDDHTKTEMLTKRKAFIDQEVCDLLIRDLPGEGEAKEA